MALLLGFPKIILSLLIFQYINIWLQIHHISAQTIENNCNNKIGNYSQNSRFQANLNTILSSVSANINKYGFYNSTIGDGVDQVNAIALCRGDVDIKSCRSCVKDAVRNLTVRCPNQKEAIVWLDNCKFRYSNNSILGVMSLEPGIILQNLNNATNVTIFSQEVHSFAGYLVEQAYDGSLRKFAGMKSNINPNTQTVYGYMQCTPDLTPAACMSCLNTIANYLSSCCYSHVGARAYSPSCDFRYEIYKFLNHLSNQPPPSPPLPLPPPPLSPLPPPPLSSSSPPPSLSPSSPSPTLSPSSPPPPLSPSSPPPPPPLSSSSPPPPLSPSSSPSLTSPPISQTPLSTSTITPTSKGSTTTKGQIFVWVITQVVFCYYFFQFDSHLNL